MWFLKRILYFITVTRAITKFLEPWRILKVFVLPYNDIFFFSRTGNFSDSTGIASVSPISRNRVEMNWISFFLTRMWKKGGKKGKNRGKVEVELESTGIRNAGGLARIRRREGAVGESERDAVRRGGVEQATLRIPKARRSVAARLWPSFQPTAENHHPERPHIASHWHCLALLLNFWLQSMFSVFSLQIITQIC